MILNIQMQLRKQKDDRKYCASFILFDLPNQRDVKASESTKQRESSSEGNKIKAIQLTNTPSPVTPLFISTVPHLVISLQMQIIEMRQSQYIKRPSVSAGPTPHIWFWGVDASG